MAANAPSAERILSILVELFADQYGVKVKYEFQKRGEESEANNPCTQQSEDTA